ncbi:hypothetical protein [Burkholderia pseudomallei]|uniref:hypothetical protein n=1 Tax=Burkholderia pseudomallei TaxID=28450 RepID=UPI001E4891AB|nr:hypothetical protein [Burkholderia pseudomallei]
MSEAFVARSRRAMRAHCPPRCDLMPHGRAPLRCGIVRAGRAARRAASRKQPAARVRAPRSRFDALPAAALPAQRDNRDDSLAVFFEAFDRVIIRMTRAIGYR